MVSIVKYLPLIVRAKCLMHLTFTLPPNKITPTKALSHCSFFKNALKDIQILHQNHDFVATLTPKMMSCYALYLLHPRNKSTFHVAIVVTIWKLTKVRGRYYSEKAWGCKV